MNLVRIESVDFYGDIIDVAFDDEGHPYVSIAQISGHLGLRSEDVCDSFAGDPRVPITEYNGAAIIALTKLNGFLLLLRVSDVTEEFQEDLMRYQMECFEVLHDYWIHGVALNRRETPYKLKSKFKDERSISRPALVKACAAYCKDREDLDASELFDKILMRSYAIVGIDPLHENEKLSGTEARYLAWIESVFASVVSNHVTWGKDSEDFLADATEKVVEHLKGTGAAWLKMATSVPFSLHH